MCGKESRLMTAEIEGGELQVCSGCAKHGKVKKVPGQHYNYNDSHLTNPHLAHLNQPPTPHNHNTHLADPHHPPFASGMSKRERPEFKVVSNYSSLIRSAREGKGMKQEDFSKLLNERESLVAKWESGSLIPRVEVAKKVGRVLGIDLVERDEEVMDKLEMTKKSDVPTLGDFITVRKRR